MKTTMFAAVLLGCATAFGTTRYVALDGHHVAPFTNWYGAATNIQAAIDVAVAGFDTVLVSDGVYRVSGMVVNNMGNRVAITSAVQVVSLNGADYTTIQGEPVMDSNAMRCAYVSGGGILEGFTLLAGATKTTGNSLYERSGGGALLENSGALRRCQVASCRAAYYAGGVLVISNAVVDQCAITANLCSNEAGGVILYLGGTLRGSAVVNNRALQSLGGVYAHGAGALVDGCVISGNAAVQNSAGGVGLDLGARIRNCKVMNNMAASLGGGVFAIGAMVAGCRVYNNLAVSNGGGVIAWSQAQVFSSTIANNYSSNIAGGLLVESGSTSANTIVYFNGATVANDDWATNGAGNSIVYSCLTPALSGPGNTALAPEFEDINTRDYHLRNVSPCRNTGTNDLVQGTSDFDGNPRIISARVDMGCYEYVPVLAGTLTHYASPYGANEFPYTNWESAARNIQSAVNAAGDGDTVLVSNGLYGAGFGEKGDMWSRVMLAKDVRVIGQGMPTIMGAGIISLAAIRGAYLSGNAALEQFQIVQGFAWYSGGGVYCDQGGTVSNCYIVQCHAQVGGGAYTYSTGMVAGCYVSGNYATGSGGGGCTAAGGTLSNCTMSYNMASIGAGAELSGGGRLTRCTLMMNRSLGDSGGVSIDNAGTVEDCQLYSNDAPAAGGIGLWSGGLVRRSRIIGNTARNGGGIYCVTGNGVAENCFVVNNFAQFSGGGVWLQEVPPRTNMIVNCTIAVNIAYTNGGGVYMAGINYIRNSIVYNNFTSGTGANWSTNGTGGGVEYCCTYPLYPGAGNISNNPGYASSLYLTNASPCINTGTNAYAALPFDSDGTPRVLNGVVDMGCLEYCPPWVDITNADFATDASTATIGGTNGYGIVGMMRWLNAALPGVTGMFFTAPGWVITNLPLAPGTNTIQVLGSNNGYEQATDTIIIDAIPEGAVGLLVLAGVSAALRRRRNDGVRE